MVIVSFNGYEEVIHLNKKIILSVFLGLLAAASSLVASLFMLQQLQGTAQLPARIAQLETAYQNIDTTVDVGPEFENLTGTVQTMVEDLNSLQNEVGDIKVTQETMLNTPSTTPTQPKTEPKTEPKTDPKTDTVVEPTAEKPEFVASARLNLREGTGLGAKIIKTLAVGDNLTYLNEKKENDGYTWLKVKDSKGNTGWVAQKFTKGN